MSWNPSIHILLFSFQGYYTCISSELRPPPGSGCNYPISLSPEFFPPTIHICVHSSHLTFAGVPLPQLSLKELEGNWSGSLFASATGRRGESEDKIVTPLAINIPTQAGCTAKTSQVSNQSWCSDFLDTFTIPKHGHLRLPSTAPVWLA